MPGFLGWLVSNIFQTGASASIGAAIGGLAALFIVQDAIVPDGCHVVDVIWYRCGGFFPGTTATSEGSVFPAYVAGLIGALVGFVTGEGIKHVWARRKRVPVRHLSIQSAVGRLDQTPSKEMWDELKAELEQIRASEKPGAPIAEGGFLTSPSAMRAINKWKRRHMLRQDRMLTAPDKPPVSDSE